MEIVRDALSYKVKMVRYRADKNEFNIYQNGPVIPETLKPVDEVFDLMCLVVYEFTQRNAKLLEQKENNTHIKTVAKKLGYVRSLIEATEKLKEDVRKPIVLFNMDNAKYANELLNSRIYKYCDYVDSIIMAVYHVLYIAKNCVIPFDL